MTCSPARVSGVFSESTATNESDAPWTFESKGRKLPIGHRIVGRNFGRGHGVRKRANRRCACRTLDIAVLHDPSVSFAAKRKLPLRCADSNHVHDVKIQRKQTAIAQEPPG